MLNVECFPKSRSPAPELDFNSPSKPLTFAPVQDLLKEIDAAAEARLTFPPNATAADKLARYKNFLKVETHRLKLLHRAGAGGIQVCQGRAAILDALLRHFWQASVSTLTPQA